MLDKKQIWVNFLSEFKICCKAAETTHSINNRFGPGTDNESTVQWWVKKFCKEDKTLEDEERSGWSSEVRKLTTTESITEADPLKTTQEVTKELSVSHSMVWHLKQIGKVKNLDKWVPREPTANQKISLKCCLLLF